MECRVCGIDKPAEDFAPQRRQCKPCRYAYERSTRGPSSGNKHPNAAEHRRRWREKNRAKLRADRAEQRAALLQRTPPWSCVENIRAVYELAGPGDHVDHEVPLRGETVSGLHVAENLRVIPARENLSKGNRW